MGERIRFHLDENVDPAIGLGLRRYGIDVTTTNDVELRTQSDEVQLVFIQETQRVLFTQDADFLIIASSRLDHPGITYCKKGTRSIGEIIETLVLIYEVMTPEEMVGRVEFVSNESSSERRCLRRATPTHCKSMLLIGDRFL
ncbi:MAG: DUF5615 family PIN-like protein [Nostoc sp.]|uniref:DUF5615 family PIN-like protein n=1 Tax=Nostoc sp. TaxID=1180 RepID=UPI002FF9A146